MIHIVMVEPEIPQNAGNVVRLTAAAGVKLHLVKPLGFVMEDKYLKRAGLDYWDMADITIHESLDEFLSEHEGEVMYLASTKSKYRYDEVTILRTRIYTYSLARRLEVYQRAYSTIGTTTRSVSL